MRRVAIHVHGRVQGVFFRASTCAEACELGLRGWVRNEADGSVRLEAQGDPSAVDQLIAWCQHGPSEARVDRVAVEDVALRGDEQGFAVR